MTDPGIPVEAKANAADSLGMQTWNRHGQWGALKPGALWSDRATRIPGDAERHAEFIARLLARLRHAVGPAGAPDEATPMLQRWQAVRVLRKAAQGVPVATPVSRTPNVDSAADAAHTPMPTPPSTAPEVHMGATATAPIQRAIAREQAPARRLDAGRDVLPGRHFRHSAIALAVARTAAESAIAPSAIAASAPRPVDAADAAGSASLQVTSLAEHRDVTVGTASRGDGALPLKATRRGDGSTRAAQQDDARQMLSQHIGASSVLAPGSLARGRGPLPHPLPYRLPDSAPSLPIPWPIASSRQVATIPPTLQQPVLQRRRISVQHQTPQRLRTVTQDPQDPSALVDTVAVELGHAFAPIAAQRDNVTENPPAVGANQVVQQGARQETAIARETDATSPSHVSRAVARSATPVAFTSPVVPTAAPRGAATALAGRAASVGKGGIAARLSASMPTTRISRVAQAAAVTAASATQVGAQPFAGKPGERPIGESRPLVAGARLPALAASTLGQATQTMVVQRAPSSAVPASTWAKPARRERAATSAPAEAAHEQSTRPVETQPRVMQRQAFVVPQQIAPARMDAHLPIASIGSTVSIASAPAVSTDEPASIPHASASRLQSRADAPGGRSSARFPTKVRLSQVSSNAPTSPVRLPLSIQPGAQARVQRQAQASIAAKPVFDAGHSSIGAQGENGGLVLQSRHLRADIRPAWQEVMFDSARRDVAAPMHQPEGPAPFASVAPSLPPSALAGDHRRPLTRAHALNTLNPAAVDRPDTGWATRRNPSTIQRTAPLAMPMQVRAAPGTPMVQRRVLPGEAMTTASPVDTLSAMGSGWHLQHGMAESGVTHQQEQLASPGSKSAAPAADLDDLVERAYTRLLDRLAVEQERRGVTRWL